jgi:hypothetical protein
MNFKPRQMQPKAIKRLSRRCGWIHIGLCVIFAAWGGLIWNDFLKWTPIPFMILVHASIYGNIIYWLLLRRSIYRRAMAADYALCDDCLYDLRETTGTCPECGKSFTPSSLRRAWLFESHRRNWFRRRV